MPSSTMHPDAGKLKCNYFIAPDYRSVVTGQPCPLATIELEEDGKFGSLSITVKSIEDIDRIITTATAMRDDFYAVLPHDDSTVPIGAEAEMPATEAIACP